MNEVCAVLRKVRGDTGLSQKDFAAKIGMKPVAYNMVESGKNQPTFELLLRIVEKFNVEPKIFFPNDGLDKPNKDDFKEGGVLNDITIEEINTALLKTSQATLMLLEFHLLDIELNLSLLNEKLYKKKFDRKKYDNDVQTVKNVVNVLKAGLSSGLASNAALIHFLQNNDELIRKFLDKIRDLSKELYLNSGLSN
jgi:transcriptional regulator with XRE-family HTH domain